ncbi:MAG: ABC transporter permease, partial [Anaerolineae bacterium]|nr:ABC transporter permease [Anaerolineae bacterium]
LAEKGNYRVGDTLNLTLNGNSGDYTVAGIFELPGQLADNANHPRDVIGMYVDDLAALDSASSEAPFAANAQGEIYANSINVILAGDDHSEAEVDAVIEELNNLLLANGVTAEFTNWVAFQNLITQIVRIFNIILYAAAALIAAVGALGLLSSLSMSVFERQKEIGVMRSVGATSGTIALQFLVEGLVIGVVAWAVGIPLGYVLSKGLAQALPFENFGLGFPPQTILIGLVGMLIITTVASLWPSLSAARRTVSDILRYQ